ncbi:hypothetical protein HDV05_006597 [Chytridiales sp. JEL 0842]|nr:hypothetical protein HDV05_006597 [Chytridiales sp. JEL 0842]
MDDSTTTADFKSARYPPSKGPFHIFTKRVEPNGIRTTITRRTLFISIAIVLSIVLIVSLSLGLTLGRNNNSRNSNVQSGKYATIGYTSAMLLCLDGFRPDYLALGITPNIARFIGQGVRGRGLIPPFPAQSFPAQYSMITGLQPAYHGIVGDYFHDFEVNQDMINSFGRNDTATVANNAFWYGDPLWVDLQKQGGIAATVNWPGSSASVNALPPRLQLPFNKTMTDAFRVRTIVSWLEGKTLDGDQLPIPNVVVTHFRAMDVNGTLFGPDTNNPDLLRTLTTLDQNVKTLMDGIDRLGLADKMNIILVSDHGIAAVQPTNVIYYEDIFDDLSKYIIVQNRPMGYIYPANRTEDITKLPNKISTTPHLKAFIQGDPFRTFPPNFSPDISPRVPPILLLPDEGYYLAFRTPGRPTLAVQGGAAGYDPSLVSMLGLFAARGPAFNKGVEIPTLSIQAVDVYPLLGKLLEMESLAAGNGSLAEMEKAGIFA